jgi:hypothetical protein
MSRESRSGLEEVAALMLERQKYESWLSSLDARRASTPDHVYNRVRGDYAARLKSVTEQLIARRSALENHMEMLNARLTQLEADTQRCHEQRSESELRMQVGELSVTDWNELVRDCDETVARLTKAQTLVRSQLQQAREILNMVARQTGGASTPTPRTPHSGRTPKVPDTPFSPNNVRLTPSGDVDELAFLQSVVGGEPDDPSGIDPGADGDGRTQHLEGAPDLAESLLDRVTRGGGPRLREDADAESLLSSIQGPPKPDKPLTPKANPLAANVTEQNPIILTPQGGGPERHKTLKCGECGVMNYPTEWYCERCGAELSAI